MYVLRTLRYRTEASSDVADLKKLHIYLANIAYRVEGIFPGVLYYCDEFEFNANLCLVVIWNSSSRNEVPYSRND